MTFDELMNAYHISEYSGNRAVYNALLQQLKNGRVTPVIGAGLSVWAGYPLWGGLLKNLAKGTTVEKDIADLLSNNEFEKAAQALSKLYRKNNFLRILADEFSPDKIDEAKRPDFQKLLPKLFRGPFATTNYDVCLERLLNAAFTVDPKDTFNEATINHHIQNHQRFLIKLHGTVSDRSHMIITEESYNGAYGDNPEKPNRDLPLPKTLETVFKASPPLFLGCSLGADRTCAVFKDCIGATGYALVEKPETDEEFDKANDRFDEMNLRVIWYPHGKHEAVEALINQLARDMGLTEPPKNPARRAAEENSYDVSKSFIGRDKVVKELAEKLMKPETNVLLVHGVSGIGKTEICKAVYQKIKEKNPGFSMPFVDITGASGLPDFWESLAEGLNIPTKDLDSDKVYKLIEAKVEKESYMLYLDNFEDILNALDGEEQNNLIHSLFELTEKRKLKLLISSQDTISLGDRVEKVEVSPLDGEVDVEALPWDELMKLDQTKLFVKKIGRTPDEDERNSFRKLIFELSGHPLSIIVTALYGRKCGSINELERVWLEVEQIIPGDRKDAHRSLRLAIELTWRKIRKNSAAVFRWALHSLSVIPLDSEIFDEINSVLKEPFSFKEWVEGGILLRRYGLTEKTSDNKERMLLSLKKLFPQLGNEAKNALYTALTAWIIVCGGILKKGDDGEQTDYLKNHDRALAFLPQCFHLAEQCLEEDETEQLNSLLYYAYNYYKYDVVRSIPLLEKLIEKTPDSFPLRCYFYEYLGDLLRITGKPDKATDAYDEAEKLFRAVHDDLGLANVLQSRGDLLRLTDKPDKATDAYDEAEKLFRAVHNDLGLANVLQCKGDLKHLQGDLEGAEKMYEQALPLYEQVRASMGKCYTLAKLQLCKKVLGDEEGRKECLAELKKLLPKQLQIVQRYAEDLIDRADSL